MGKEILVNAANRETRIAVIDDRQLVELRIEREEPVVGNVYKGRVENVLPGMDAAFVDIGLERNAFLYVADILPEAVDQGEQDEDDEEEVVVRQPRRQRQPQAQATETVDVTPEDAALVAEANAILEAHHDDSESLSDEDDNMPYAAEGDDASLNEYAVETEELVLSDANAADYEYEAQYTEDEATAQEFLDEQIAADGESVDDSEEDEIEPVESLDASAESAPEKAIRQDKRPPRRQPGRGGPRGFRRQVPIAELVQTRQELVVQVVKGPRGTKGSRVSTRMSFPGRYLVLMPDANNLGVSRKIEEARERDRLKRIVEKFRQQGFGIIVRTEAEGRKASDLYQDYLMLVETWKSIQTKSKITPAPGLIHQDMSLIYTIIRDAFGSDVDKLILDSPEDYARAHDIVGKISPELSNRIHLYDGVKPMFEHYRIEDDIERLLRRKVWLRSGGYLVIDQTEALTSIDINTGKFTGGSGSGLSETIFQTNMEATGEIARQLRLRDMGGMIILDFIDMDNPRDKKSVTDALVKALKNDRSRTKISSISPLGLIEMTRKRTKETVDVALTDICPYCHGLGRVGSAETVSLQVEREIVKLAAGVTSEALLVNVHPDVAAQIIGAEGEDIEKLERQVRRAIYVRVQPHWHIEKFEVEPGTMARIEQAFPMPKRGTVIECTPDKSVLALPPWATAHIQGGYQVDITNAGKLIGQNVRVRLLQVGRSLAIGECLNTGGKPQNPPRENQGQRGGEQGSGRGPRTPAGAGV